jgi:hypothetical protein
MKRKNIFENNDIFESFNASPSVMIHFLKATLHYDNMLIISTSYYHTKNIITSQKFTLKVFSEYIFFGFFYYIPICI